MTLGSAAGFLVRVIHIIFILWMIWAPFSKHDESLVMHAIVAPFLMIHWMTGNSQCALTLLEKHLRGLEDDTQSFIHSIVAPVYVISDESLKTWVFASTIVLWFISLSRINVKRVKKVFGMSYT